MTSNVFHDAPHWGMASSHDVQNADTISDIRSEECGQLPFLAANFPLVINSEFDPWLMHRFGWSGELAPGSEQFSGKWDPTTVDMEYKGKGNGELAIGDYTPPDFGNSVPQWDDSRDTMSQLATERALFMTPSSAYHPPFPTFPGSPISDLSSTPDISQASGLWETDYDRSSLPATTETYVQAPKSESQGTASGYFSGEEEDDYPTTLEMPDGSTRRTSNWLPVDPQAGFTIGCHTIPSYTRFEGMEDIQQAFISPNTAEWTYDG